MAEHELMSAKYLSPETDTSSTGGSTATEQAQKSPSKKTSPAAGWALASRWISALVGVALVACAVGLVFPRVKTASKEKPANSVDWLLRFATGRSDVSVEKYLRDQGEANRREWDEKYRESPISKIDPTKPIEWKFPTSANFNK